MLQSSNTSIKSSQFQQDLFKFPPILRRLATFIINCKDFMSISEYCQDAGISWSGVRVATFRSRKKDNDFNELLRKIWNEKLTAYRPQVMNSLVQQALKGSHRHQELYFRLCGDLYSKSKVEQNVHNSLTFILPMPDSLPEKQSITKAELVDITPDPEG